MLNKLMTTHKQCVKFNTVAPLKNTKQSTGLQSLRVNYLETNHVTSKCQMQFLNKTCKIRPKTEKMSIIITFYIFKIVLTPNFSSNNFEFLIILNLHQSNSKRVFLIYKKVTIELYIFELV